ncbi:MAG: hypothetical protein ACKO2P_03790 [Planctomycetota bacterium]
MSIPWSQCVSASMPRDLTPHPGIQPRLRTRTQPLHHPPRTYPTEAPPLADLKTGEVAGDEPGVPTDPESPVTSAQMARNGTISDREWP